MQTKLEFRPRHIKIGTSTRRAGLNGHALLGSSLSRNLAPGQLSICEE